MWDVHLAPGQTLEVAEHMQRRPGGAAANVALALRNAGSAAAVAGVLSDDPLGHGLRAALQRHGVDVSALVHLPGRTGLVFIEHGAVERFVSYRPQFERYPSTLSLPAAFTGRALHLASLNPDPAELEALATLARRVRAQQGWVVVDINARPRAWRPATQLPSGFLEVVRCAQIVKASSADLALLSACAVDIREQLVAAVADAGALFITRGAEATLVSGNWGELSELPPSLEPTRTIGAGDAFCSGLLRALLAAESSRFTEPTGWLSLLRAGHEAAAEHLEGLSC